VPTRTGAALGTAYYMSPEQARGATDVDLRTDVWSLGVVLYQLLSGQRPFQGEQFLHIIHRILSFDPTPLGTLQPDLPPALLDVVARSMSKDVDARLPSAEALEAALAPFSERTPSQLEPAPVREHPARTEITPATSVDGVSVGHTGARPLPGLEPRSGGTGQRRPAGLIVVAAVAAVLAGWLGWRGLRPPAESTGSALPASTAPPVPAAVTSVPGVDTSLAASPSPTTAPLPPASASASAAASVEPPPRSSPRAGEPGLAARPASAVRSLSEHSRLSSNTSDSRPSATGVIVPTPAEPASAAPAPPVLRGSSAQKRTIDIEEGNPYE
jgi:serine/threonine-protein kinase